MNHGEYMGCPHVLCLMAQRQVTPAFPLMAAPLSRCLRLWRTIATGWLGDLESVV